MTTFRFARGAPGAQAVAPVITTRAAKVEIRSDRTFLDDARWAPRLWSGNSHASFLPERTTGSCDGTGWPSSADKRGGRARGCAGAGPGDRLGDQGAGWAIHPRVRQG